MLRNNIIFILKIKIGVRGIVKYIDRLVITQKKGLNVRSWFLNTVQCSYKNFNNQETNKLFKCSHSRIRHKIKIKYLTYIFQTVLKLNQDVSDQLIVLIHFPVTSPKFITTLKFIFYSNWDQNLILIKIKLNKNIEKKF